MEGCSTVVVQQLEMPDRRDQTFFNRFTMLVSIKYISVYKLTNVQLTDPIYRNKKHSADNKLTGNKQTQDMIFCRYGLE